VYPHIDVAAVPYFFAPRPKRLVSVSAVSGLG
jgi:hypothetical protein